MIFDGQNDEFHAPVQTFCIELLQFRHTVKKPYKIELPEC